MAKPKEARTIIDKKEKLDTQKHYLELRQEYARALEDRNAVGALLDRNESGEERPGYFEDEDLFENKENKVKELEGKINELEDDKTMIPQRFVDTDNFDREFLDAQLNKVRGELMEPIPKKKAEFTIALRDEEREMIKKNFPFGLYPKGDKVKYEGDEWEVAGYDGYTGRGILKRQLGPGQTEYIFAERIPLYLENRVKSKDLGKDGVVSLDEMTKQHGLNHDETQAMSDDDAFDDEQAQAEQDARQPEKTESKFRDWVKGKYDKFKKEVGSLPQDIRDIIETEREPFKATMKDVNKDLTKVAEKFDRWTKGREQAMVEAWVGIKQANEFRAITNEMVKDLNKSNEFFGQETKLRKWMESDFDSMVVDDETLSGFYEVVNKVREAQGIEATKTKEERVKMYNIIFDSILKAKTAARDVIQEKMVTNTTEQLKEKLLSISPELNDNPEEVERRLNIFKEELNKEFGRLRQFQVAINTRRMASLIRSLLNKDYWQDYVYGPLKIFQPVKQK